MPPESSVAELVRTVAVTVEGNPFEELRDSVRFEELGRGRRGAVLVKYEESAGVPVVRTTSKYGTPAQPFRPAHEWLAERVRTAASLPVGFNNALVEIYTNEYATMGAHSDQALDLADESFIAVYSCYEHPDRASPPRKLLVESKGPGGDRVDFPLTHGGVLVFSVGANRRFRHKIVLESSARQPENRWLGFTFRTSKTFVRYHAEQVSFEDGSPLTLADDEQRRDFYRLRGRENRETDFTYPRITYTLSESDLMPPDVA